MFPVGAGSALHKNGTKAMDRDEDEKKQGSRGGGFVPIGDVIANLTGRFADRPQSKARELRLSWVEAVGERVAKHSHPERFMNGVLTVRVDSSPWASELMHMKSQVLASLQKTIPGSKIKDLRFVQGSLRHQVNPSGAKKPTETLPPPTPEEVKRATAMVEKVSNPELRSALYRLVQVILIRRRCG